MTIVITTNEPPEIRDLFEDKVELPMPYDMKLYTGRGIITIERKKVPGDLLTSVTDGRLKRELAAMREESPVRILLLHGKILYDREGRPIMRWTKRAPVTFGGWNSLGIRNLFRTLQYVEGVFIEVAESNKELVSIVSELQNYFDRDKHMSLKTRPNLESAWPVTQRSEQVMHFFMGIPGISASRAKTLYDKYKEPLDLYSATVEDLDLLPGFADIMATHVYSFLRQGCSKECKLCQ